MAENEHRVICTHIYLHHHNLEQYFNEWNSIELCSAQQTQFESHRSDVKEKYDSS